jgi:hypothetical protein
MSKANRVATERIVSNAGIGDLKELQGVFNDPDIDLSTTPFGSPPGEDNLMVKSAVDWKGGGELPAAVQSGLQTAQSRAQQTRGSTNNGTKVDPRTGNEVPGHVLDMIGRSAMEGRLEQESL